MELTDVLGLPVWAVTTCLAFILFYIYLNKNYSYWKSRGIPSVKAYPILGSFASYLNKPFHIEETIRYKKYGRIYGAYEGRKPVLSVGDPELLRDIFIKDFGTFPDRRNLLTGDPIADHMVSALQGEDWKRVRTIITPAFTSGKLRKLASIMNECAQTVIENFTIASKKGIPVDCKRLFGAFTMDVICCSAFGTKIDSHNDADNKMVEMARKTFSRGPNWRFLLFFAAPSLMKLLKIRIFTPSITQFFKEVTLQMIKERKAGGKPREDFLQLLMDAANETATDDLDEDLSEMGHEEGNKKVFNINIKNKSLTLDELVAQCVLFFLAGYETTASTLSFVAYNLAQHPELQDRLIKEVDDVFAKNKVIDYDVVKNMQFLDCVISETLRKFPPAVRGDRLAAEDYKLGETGITIPKGMNVTIPIYPIHYDEEYYPNPDKFDPDRFLPENKANRNPYTYLPFGAGPRNCIGMRFAQMEMKLCLVQVFRQIRFRVCPQTKIPLDFYNGNGLHVPKEVTLAVELRKDVTAT